jgi:subtilisin
MRPIARLAATAALVVSAGQLHAQARVIRPGQEDRLPQFSAQLQTGGNRVIIGLRPGFARRQVDSAGTALRGRGYAIRSQIYLVPALVAEVPGHRITALLRDPAVAYVEVDERLAINTADVPVRPSVRPSVLPFAQSLPWGIDRVNAPEAWPIVADGAGVKVGILDSGGDIDHPDLLFAGGYDATGGSTAPSAWDDNLPSCNGHGTHVAGTVAARNNTDGVVGVAPGVSLYAIKVFVQESDGCWTYASRQAAGIDWAVQQGIRVLNASFGGSQTPTVTVQTAIQSAYSRGVYFVASAGNSAGPVGYPAKYAEAIAVASLNGSNARSSFSNYGPEVAVAAPGEGLYSTMPGGGYGNKSGTSMAAPHVTGVVALLLARSPNASRDEIMAALRNGALDLGAAGRDDYYGHGLARAYEGVLALGTPPAAVLSLNPVSRRDSVASGSTTLRADSATVSLTGTAGATTAWIAAKRKAWTTLTTASGTGPGKLRWTRNPAGLAAGTYVDTITVTAAGATGSPSRVIDTLRVLPPPSLAVSPASRRDSVGEGSPSLRPDSASVTLSGSGASTIAWSAAKRAAWLSLTTASGTGSGRLRWTRNPSGLAVGTYVDTIVVTASGVAGSPARVVDSLVVLPVPVISVSPATRRDSVVAGSPAIRPDSATVTLTGTLGGGVSWTAAKRKAWTTLTTASGTGTGRVRWSRNPSGLAAGVYVDTITVRASGASGSPARVIDSLVVSGQPADIVLSPKTRKRFVPKNGTNGAAVQGVSDSAQVNLQNAPAGQTWLARTPPSWLVLRDSTGASGSWLRWTMDVGNLGVGTYVQTVTVTAGALTAQLVDTAVVVEPPAANAAGEDLFTASRLTPDQRLWLDQEGNRNGRFDVGDFLAFLQRTGAQPSADLMARIAGKS